MTGQSFVDRVREAERTELERLGSDKALLAATDANLETGAVLRTVAGELTALATALREWGDATDDETLGETFRTVAAEADDHVGTLRDELDGEDVPAAEEVTERLTGLDGGIEAAGGLVGYSLVLDRTLLQVINFFINEADERRADLVRDVRGSVDGWIDDGSDVLGDHCTRDADWDRAHAGAVDVIDDAYEDYVDTLGELGIDPKPVC